VRDLERIDVPVPRQVGHVRVVVPVAEPGQVAVRAALAGVLRGGLAVHLQDPAAGLAEHAAHQVQVVDLHRGRGGLVGLVEALQHGGQQPLGLAEHLRWARICPASTRQIRATSSGGYSSTRLASSSNPRVWAST
jgi:hypothetical protein